MAPTTYGQAAASLTGTPTWTTQERARAGARGEQRTAIAFSALPPSVAVLHDLRIPIPRITANVDHALVSGTQVWLIDSKQWAAGRYWTLFGHSFRGFRRFGPADKKTMSMASTRYKTVAPAARLERPIVVVHSASPARPVKLGLLRMPGARVMTAKQFERFLAGVAKTALPADAGIVAAYRQLLNRAPRQAVAARS